MKKFNLTLLLLFVFVLSSCSQPEGKKTNTEVKAKAKKPNILFVLLDDMGKEWVESYGAEEVKTPNIDRLAEGGMQFENAWSMPQCTPSRITLLTGQYPWRHGWINHYDVPRWGHGAQFDATMNLSFAKVMKKAGYKTCAAGKWQVNDFRLQPNAMSEHGFDEYAMWTGAEGGNVKVSQERYWDPYIHTKEGSKTYKGEFGEDIFTDFIIDFMRKNKENPMMIYYPMCLPHGPLVHTPAEPNATGKMDKHKAMVRYTDIILKKLTDALDELKLRENTIIVWTTDNGTGGNITGTMNGRRVRGGKTYLTENGVNAPFIVNCPGLVPSGVKTDALIDFSDIFPTFADLGGVSVSNEQEIDGKSFAPLLLGETKVSSRDWIMALGSNAATLEKGRVKNIYEFRDRVIRNKRFKAFVNTNQKINEIFDLSVDLEEVNNLIDSEDPEVVSALKAFDKVVQSLPAKDAQPKYSKLEGSLYDVDIEVLKKQHKKNRTKGNHAPKAN
jgi:arylsulfatase A-like enzyme